ncbi:hypothetical protein [Pseudonocardia spinosispora]|uniref:hypothetical protein n=1 Tax=Pseudonocardia spinosispora TaxID=103441 RepID=UPI0003FC8324|nr:hypothetical protein [Pseudonocardia spinosispora]
MNTSQAEPIVESNVDSASPDFPDGSIERLEQLRTDLTQHDATATRRHEELSAELARQEAIWSANEARRIREEQLNAATADYETALDEYRGLASTAADSFGELHAITCSAAILVRAAVRAEQAKREAQPVLESAWRRLRELNDEVAEPTLAPFEDFDFGPYDPRSSVLRAGLLVYPETRGRLAQLTSEDPGSVGAGSGEPPAEPSAEPKSGDPDQLDVIFRRAQAKREQDDQAPLLAG